jgi:hypothetical protein
MKTRIEEEHTKKSITISIDRDLLNNLNVKNKSKLINWLLKEFLTENDYEFKKEF